jgi:hypothetical protein
LTGFESTGASRVFIFDHTIRRATIDNRDGTSGKITRGPGFRVHIDQTYKASENRVKYHLPNEAEELLKKRFQIINVSTHFPLPHLKPFLTNPSLQVWRPIRTIFRDPLGLADAHSVPESDLVAAKLIYPDREGETFAVKPNPAHRWYFKYAQRPDEPLFIKCYDSIDDGRARRVPHSAFVNKKHENDATRESIEVRTLVFYD